MNFESDVKYPEGRVKGKNKRYAYILLDDYAGKDSEMTAINQYMYDHYYSDKYDEEIADILRGIAIVEMKHMETLGELILDLGGDPKYTGGYSTKGRFWTPKYINYNKELCKMLHADLESEKIAIYNYRKHIKMIDDIYIKKVLYKIIQDEIVHTKILMNLINKHCCKYDKFCCFSDNEFDFLDSEDENMHECKECKRKEEYDVAKQYYSHLE